MSKPRILLAADVNSSHTRKWAEALSGSGFDMAVFSLRAPEGEWSERHPAVRIYSPGGISGKTFHGGVISKAAYLKVLPALKRAIKDFQPDILHAHYASSYGLLGRLSGFHPFIISCWGSDVMDFPNKGIVQKVLLKGNLRKADRVLATSPTIERYVHKVVDRDVIITPFGVDATVFSPQQVRSPFPEGSLVIGTIKSLEKVYCIDVLITAFGEISKTLPQARLLLVGEGTQRKTLEEQCARLGISGKVIFTGRVDHAEVPRYHNMIDVFVNISEYESFGVAVLEAMACEKAVVITDTGGLAEIVNDEALGIKVPVRNSAAVANAILRLSNEALRRVMGAKARKRVMEYYEWKSNVKEMIAVYESLLNQQK